MRATLAVLALALASCDNREAVRELDPTLSRMLTQRRADAYEATSAFPDGKVMQRPPSGTVPVDDDTDLPPPPVTRELLELGHRRFEEICSVCHGVDGSGVSVVASKMALRPPPALVSDAVRTRPRQQMFQFITEGYGLMNSYRDILSREERWAVVSYVQALQLSRHARAATLPAPLRDRLSTSSEGP